MADREQTACTVKRRVTRCGLCELSWWTYAGRVGLVVIVSEAGSGNWSGGDQGHDRFFHDLLAVKLFQSGY